MNFFRTRKTAPKPTISRQDALRCVPVVNESVKVLEGEGGDVLLEYPLPMKPFFISLFRRFQKTASTSPTPVPTKKLQLDNMGTIVWQQIDGSNTVKVIITDFAERFQISGQEAEQSVTKFLYELGRRGIIALR